MIDEQIEEMQRIINVSQFQAAKLVNKGTLKFDEARKRLNKQKDILESLKSIKRLMESGDKNEAL